MMRDGNDVGRDWYEEVQHRAEILIARTTDCRLSPNIRVAKVEGE